MSDMTDTIVRVANISLITFIAIAAFALTKIFNVVISAYTQWMKNDVASITLLNQDANSFMNVHVKYPKGDDIWVAAYNQDGETVSLRKVTILENDGTKEGVVDLDSGAKRARLFAWSGSPSPDISNAIWTGTNDKELSGDTALLTEIQF